MPAQPAREGSLPNIPVAVGSYFCLSHHSLLLSKVPLQPNCYQWDSGSLGDAVWCGPTSPITKAQINSQWSSLFFSPLLFPFPFTLPAFFPKQNRSRRLNRMPDNAPAQSHPTIPGLSSDIYDTSHSCHVNPPGEGGPKSSCQGARRIPLWKRTPLSDTRVASGISGSLPLLLLFGLGRGAGQGRNINGTVGMAPIFPFVAVSGGDFPSGILGLGGLDPTVL